MGVILNHKICDNAKECGGIEVCPTGALYWDKEAEKVAIDNSKCVDCDLCERACGVGALRVFHNEEEKKQIEEEIKNDPRKVSDLFVDKYGAMPMKNSPANITADDFEEKVLKSEGMVAVELFEDDSIECLLKSIPVKELFANDVKFRKVEITGELRANYDVKELPCLLFFNQEEVIGKIEGFFGVDENDKLLEKIDNIIKT